MSLALFCTSDPVRKSVMQVLALSQTAEIQEYGKMSDLLAAILAGNVSGIIGISTSKDADVERHIRHDLKNLPGWGYEKAQAFPLPPCKTFGQPINIGAVLLALPALCKGKREEVPVFSLEASLPALRKIMRPPVKGSVRITIVDDDPGAIEGIFRIFKVWPDVSVRFVQVFPSPQTSSLLDTAFGDCTIDTLMDPRGAAFQLAYSLLGETVILLDEDMPVKGEWIARLLTEKLGFPLIGGTIVSTTGKEKACIGAQHFPLKTAVSTSQQAAEKFIALMNTLLG